MSDTHAAPAGGADAVAPAPVSTPADTSPITASEAGRLLAASRRREQQPAKAVETPEAPLVAAEVHESEADAEDSAPEKVRAEAEEASPVVEEQPSIDPPRSWPKEKKEAFKLLPPDLQRDVAEVERSREAAFLRSQNEAAEKLKGLTAKEQAAEQIRQQYEQGLQGLQQELQSLRSGEFSDIKTQADVERLANEDWPRFARWQAHQMKVDAIARESYAAQERQTQEFKARFSEYTKEQDRLLNERAPELADKSASEKLTKAAQGYLADLGFKPEELSQAWEGRANLSLRDHRVGLLILDAVKYQQAKANIAKPAPKPVPQVQRPGTSKAPTSAADAQVQTLKTSFERNPSAKNLAALMTARRSSA